MIVHDENIMPPAAKRRRSAGFAAGRQDGRCGIEMVPAVGATMRTIEASRSSPLRLHVDLADECTPKRLRAMTVEETGSWLATALADVNETGWVGALISRIVEEEVDGMTLLRADHRMLQSLGVPTIGKRELVLRRVWHAQASLTLSDLPKRPDAPSTNPNVFEPIILVASFVSGFSLEQMIILRHEPGLCNMLSRVLYTIVVSSNFYAFCSLVVSEVSMLQLGTKTPDVYEDFCLRTKHHRAWGKLAGLYAMPLFLLACCFRLLVAHQSTAPTPVEISWDVCLVSVPCLFLSAGVCLFTIMDTRWAFHEELLRGRRLIAQSNMA